MTKKEHKALQHKDIIRKISQLLDVAGLLFIFQESANTQWQKLSDDLRASTILWANDVYARASNQKPVIDGKQKINLFNSVSKAINNVIEAVEAREGVPAIIAHELETLHAAKKALITYLDDNAIIAGELQSTEKIITHLFIAFGDALSEAQT